MGTRKHVDNPPANQAFMNSAHKDINVFVLGDVVLDHFIMVTDKRRPFQAAGTELVVDGYMRKTFAGGAANCARLLAAMSSGRSSLWGVSGYSPWGAFPLVLQRLEGIDQAIMPVIYRGAHSDSHPMNTITRIVYKNPAGILERRYRIDDVPQIPVIESEVRDAVDYVRAEAREHGIDAIIFNDLDMKALNADLVKAVGDIAATARIPVFVDPKRDWTIFRDIAVTCALPNLTEWCHLVGEAANEHKWRREINNPDTLRRMAVRSLWHMPNATFQIIKCDSDGAVVIGPEGHGDQAIYRLPPHPGRVQAVEQLGPGDVLVAALALAHAQGSASASPMERMLSALRSASCTVACYMEMGLQVMPNKRELDRFTRNDPEVAVHTSVPAGVLLLPQEATKRIDLSDHAVRRSRLVTLDPVYRQVVDDLTTFLSAGWEGTLSSAILTGRGGVGKSEIGDILTSELKRLGITVWADFDASPVTCPDVRSAISVIRERWASMPAAPSGLLVLIDEAFASAGHLLHGEAGKLLLQQAAGATTPTRFLFIDADFHRHREALSPSQFLSRCSLFELPPLRLRMGDVPYIFAAACLRAAEGRLTGPILISEATLVAINNWILHTEDSNQSARNVARMAGLTVQAALAGAAQSHKTLEISKRHLPAEVLAQLGPMERSKAFYEFWWGSSGSAGPAHRSGDTTGSA